MEWHGTFGCCRRCASRPLMSLSSVMLCSHLFFGKAVDLGAQIVCWKKCCHALLAFYTTLHGSLPHTATTFASLCFRTCSFVTAPLPINRGSPPPSPTHKHLLLLLPRCRCGSPRASTMSPGPPLFTGSASKPAWSLRGLVRHVGFDWAGFWGVLVQFMWVGVH